MRFTLALLLLLSGGCDSEKGDTGPPPVDTGEGPVDADQDGYPASEDCDDENATIHPGATEMCNDGVDNDCDGDVDEEDDRCAPDSGPEDTGTHVDSDYDGYPASEDCDDSEATVNPGMDEICGDGVDNDCDGETDDATAVDALTWYPDADGDGYGVEEGAVDACEQPTGYVELRTDEDEEPLWDCDDERETDHPEADEVCDGYDNDCDDEIDEDDATDASTWYADDDGDGYGDATATTTACAAPTGYVGDATDCDDDDEDTHPAADEYCNGYDDDCDGDTDESSALDAETWYRDADEDGYGDPDESAVSCEQPSGYVSDATDCQDHDADIQPGADEYCNGYDDDCDGDTDEDSALDTTTWYRDADGDGWGDLSVTKVACYEPSGYVENFAEYDCDDSDDAIYPDAPEICNDLDDNCSGDVDEDAMDATTWYLDADGDGYGEESGTTTAEACDAPSGYAGNTSDCDDTDASVHPGASEVRCNGTDDDCDDTTEDAASEETCWNGVDDDCDAGGLDSNGCTWLDVEDIHIASPGSGTAYDYTISYDEELDSVVPFLAPRSVVEDGDDQCDFTTSISVDTSAHEVTFSVTLEHCGSGTYADGFEAHAVVVGGVDDGAPAEYLDLEVIGGGTDTTSTSFDDEGAHESLGLCSALTSDGEGDADTSFGCSASLSSSTLSGELEQHDCDSSNGNCVTTARVVGLGLGDNASTEMAAFTCNVPSSSGVGTDTVTHTLDTGFSHHYALVLPYEYEAASGDHITYATDCTESATTYSCTVYCNGSGSSTYVSGYVLFVDGDLH